MWCCGITHYLRGDYGYFKDMCCIQILLCPYKVRNSYYDKIRSINNDNNATIFKIVDKGNNKITELQLFQTFSRFQFKISGAQRKNNWDTCQSSIYGFWLFLWHYISKKILCKDISHFLLLEQFRTENPRDCSDVPIGSTSGVYRIYQHNSDVIDVYCDMDIDGGGWTVCRCKRKVIQW